MRQASSTAPLRASPKSSVRPAKPPIVHGRAIATASKPSTRRSRQRDQIRSASGDHAAHLNEQVGRIDNALAGAVDKLSAALEPLTELADQIEDLLGKMQAQE
jgi:hypothetical protein